MSSADHVQHPRLLTRKSLQEAGLEPHEINARIRKGEFVRIAKGSYVDPSQVAGAYPEVLFRLRSLAHAEKSPQLVLSHQSALVVHGVSLFGVNWQQVHLTRSSSTGAVDAPHRVVHSNQLAPSDIATINGIRLTSVARSLIDYARVATFESAVVAIDSALQKRLVTTQELVAALAGVRGRRGCPAARKAVLFGDHRSESVGESRLRVIMHTVGVPTALTQVEILNERGRKVGRVDLALPELAVLIEFDGNVKYQADMRPGQSPSDAVVAERMRERALIDLGYEVVRFCWADLRDPQAIRTEILQAIARSRRRLVAEPARGTWRQAA